MRQVISRVPYTLCTKFALDLPRQKVRQGAGPGKLDISVGVGFGLFGQLLGPGDAVRIANPLARSDDAAPEFA